MIAELLLSACLCGGASGPYAPAVRVNPPVQVDPCVAAERAVDSLNYEWGNMEPVRSAYRTVASRCLGWTPNQISQWEPFIVDDVIKEESGGCWNVLRKAVLVDGCEFRYPNGAAEDAGFFQLTAVWYGRDGYLCATFGTCGRDAIVASPFSSMISGLRAMMHDGSRPWCYDARARRFHSGCNLVPRDW